MKKYKANCIDKTFPESDELHNLEITGYGESKNEFWSKTREELSGTGIIIITVEEVPKKESFVTRVIKSISEAFRAKVMLLFAASTMLISCSKEQNIPIEPASEDTIWEMTTIYNGDPDEVFPEGISGEYIPIR